MEKEEDVCKVCMEKLDKRDNSSLYYCSKCFEKKGRLSNSTLGIFIK